MHRIVLTNASIHDIQHITVMCIFADVHRAHGAAAAGGRQQLGAPQDVRCDSHDIHPRCFCAALKPRCGSGRYLRAAEHHGSNASPWTAQNGVNGLGPLAAGAQGRSLGSQKSCNCDQGLASGKMMLGEPLALYAQRSTNAV